MANGAACVRAAEGPWNGPEQLALIANFDQPSVEVNKGDVVGAVLVATAGQSETTVEPEVAHVWQDWDELHNVAEIDVPTVEYYEKLKAYMQAKFRGASECALEHLDALEALLDVCIAGGYALGASKSKDRLLQRALEALGELCGREGKGQMPASTTLKIIKGVGRDHGRVSHAAVLGNLQLGEGTLP